MFSSLAGMPLSEYVRRRRMTVGLPDEILPLDQLKDLLLSPATNVEVRDAVWRELVVRARREGPAWVVAAVGVAMPGLRRVAGMLAAGWRGDTDDLDSELIVGFVARLKTIDLGVARICGRLIDAGLRTARKARDADSDAQLLHAYATGPIAPIHPWGPPRPGPGQSGRRRRHRRRRSQPDRRHPPR